MYHSSLRKDPLLILGSKCKKSRSQVRVVYIPPTNSFADYNSCLDLSIVFKLHVCITHHSGNTPVEFEVKGQSSLHLATNYFWMKTPVWIKLDIGLCSTHHPENPWLFYFRVRRSKAKVTGEDCLQICLWMITPVRINELFSDLTQLSHKKKTLIFVQKGQGHRPELFTNCFCIYEKCVSVSIIGNYSQTLHIHVCITRHTTKSSVQFGFEKANVQGHRSWLDQNMFDDDNSSLNR